MTSITDLTIANAIKSLNKKEISAIELTKAFIKSSEKAGSLNSYITFTPEIALKMAKFSQEKINSGDCRLLEGIPIAIKDLFATNGTLTTASSKILSNFVPNYESTVTQNLWDAGAVMLGKVGCDEFAMGSSNETSFFGNIYNPWGNKLGRKLVPGGSSGGSAAIVAARGCMGATGTDTGGSIRQPASFCGITGIKPTYGRCSRWGIVAFASSLDQAGPMAKTVADSAILLYAMSGYDEKDSTSSDRPNPDILKNFENQDLKGLKVGIPMEYNTEKLDKDISSLWDRGADWLKERGAEIQEVTLPHTKYALPAYYVIAPAEASSNLARYDGVKYGLREDAASLDDLYSLTRGEGFGEEVKRRILIGTYVLSAGYYDAYYRKAQRIRNLILNDFKKVFENVDILLTPTTPSSAFEVGAKMDPVNMYMNDIFTVPASLAGLPAMNIPAGIDSNGLPLGLQLIANHFDELGLVKFGAALENAAKFKFL
tara:strand:- start:255 stop:1709 length:1455 start_codon:yes stop_codon:yes gene_type:complete